MNGYQGNFIAGQAWHTESPLQGATRMECGARYCLSSVTPKNPSSTQLSASLVQAHSGFIM